MKVIGTFLQQTQCEAVSQQHSLDREKEQALLKKFQGVDLPSLASLE